MASFGNDVFVVLRTSGERTEKLCTSILERSISPESVAIISEKPFSAAVSKGLDLGIESGAKWLLTLDADVLLFPDAISRLVQNAEKLPSKFFEYQGLIFDKFFGIKRSGGPHLFRSEYLIEAITEFEYYQEDNRPESWVFKKMSEKGYPYFHGTELYGVHDYEQSLKDCFRKGVQHGIKHKKYHKYLIDFWSKKQSDPDYLVALVGLFFGQRLEHKPVMDSSLYEEEFNKVLELFGLEEKPEIDITSNKFLSKVIPKMRYNRSQLLLENYFLKKLSCIGLLGGRKTSLVLKNNLILAKRILRGKD